MGDQEQMGSVRVRSHVAAGTRRRVRLPVSFGMLLTVEILISSRSGGESVVAVFMCLCLSYYPVFMCLCLSYFLLARSNEIFSADSGAVHSMHCLARGDVAFYADGTQLQYMRWRQADRVEVRLEGSYG